MSVMQKVKMSELLANTNIGSIASQTSIRSRSSFNQQATLSNLTPKIERQAPKLLISTQEIHMNSNWKINESINEYKEGNTSLSYEVNVSPPNIKKKDMSQHCFLSNQNTADLLSRQSKMQANLSLTQNKLCLN